MEHCPGQGGWLLRGGGALAVCLLSTPFTSMLFSSVRTLRSNSTHINKEV